MSDPQTGAGSDAIRCEDLWMVFGAGSEPALTKARAGQSARPAAEIAADLSGAGLIPAVQDVSFSVGEGELFVIMGLSGSGKSTLIRCLSRLQEPTAGSVTIAGEDILAAKRARLTEIRREKLGMVFQHFGLFPHMTVAENVAYPLRVKGEPRKARTERALEVLRLVGLEGREDAYPRELSGGQRQRVGIARSLAVNPPIWFLDEPFSALDPLIRRQLQDEFLDIQRRLKKSIVFITHDITEALKLADRIMILRDGRIVQIGTPSDIVLNPVDDYVREFTRDVPRGRHAEVGSVMESAGAGVSDGHGPTVRSDMTLDEALAACCDDIGPVDVAGPEGEVIGRIHPRDLANALTPESS